MSVTPNPDSKVAQLQLAAAGRRRDFASRLASAATVGAMTLLLVGLVALLNYWLMLPVLARWGAFAAMVSLVLAGAWHLSRLWRRPTSLKEAALDFEAQRSDAHCEVSTAAEYLAGSRRVCVEFEAELVDALGQKAATRLQQSPVPYQRRLVKPLAAVAGVLVALAVFAVAFPSASIALTRTVAPWSSAAFTQIEVRPGNVEWPMGQDLTLTNIFTGRLPRVAEIEVRQAVTSTPTRVVLQAGTNGVFLHTWHDVRGSFLYRVSGADAVSAEFTVTAYTPPAVKSARVRIEPPTYTGRPAVEIQSPDITALKGSRAALRITPNVPLSRARLRLGGDTYLDLQAVEGDWSVSLTVTQDTEYWIELFDQKGRKGGSSKPHRITVVPDAAPTVDFAKPGQDIRAAATNVVPLQVIASDDFGVADIRILYHRMGGPEQELPVKRPASSDSEIQAEAELDLSALKLQPYELVAYHAEARDSNSVDGPGVGRSPVYFIEITHEEGGPSKSKPTPGQKVNLLLLQKQIIADTLALSADGKPSEFQELALRQKDAMELGRMYQAALEQTSAPAAVQEQLTGAVAAMKSAVGSLEQRQRATALPSEEAALAGLYQTLRRMPALENLPTTPPSTDQQSPPPAPALKVVLEAIKQQRKQTEAPPEVAKLLEQLQELARQQTSISAACPNPGSNAGGSSVDPRPTAPPANVPEPASAAAAGKAPTPDASKTAAQLAKAAAKSGKSPAKSSGNAASPAAGKSPGQGPGQGQAAAGKTGEKPGPPAADKSGQPKPDSTAEKPEAPSASELAAKEESLSREAKALGERIQRAAGKGSRPGNKAGQRVGQAAAKMAAAAQALRQGDRATAGSNSAEGSAALGSATALLENWIAGKPELIDVSAESAPRQFEGPIADYFKRLSHAQ